MMLGCAKQYAGTVMAMIGVVKRALMSDGLGIKVDDFRWKCREEQGSLLIFTAPLRRHHFQLASPALLLLTTVAQQALLGRVHGTDMLKVGDVRGKNARR